MKGKAPNLYSKSLNELVKTGVVGRYKFRHPGRYNYEKLYAYLVDSEINPQVTYGIDRVRLCIFDRHGFITCKIKDTDKLLELLKKPVKDELEEILQDVEDLRRMEIEYETPMPGLYAQVRGVPR